jgi:hypothetical protein
MRIAGGEPAKIFTRDAVVLIHQASRGIARTISVICDNALVTAFAANVKPVGSDIVREVCNDLRVSDERLGSETTTGSPLDFSVRGFFANGNRTATKNGAHQQNTWRRAWFSRLPESLRDLAIAIRERFKGRTAVGG